MAVNPTPQSDQNKKESAVLQADNNPYAEWTTTDKAANRTGLLGSLAEKSDSIRGQLDSHHRSEEQEKEAKKKEEAAQLLITRMLQLERLEREYYILQQQISDLKTREQKALEDARLLQKEAGGLHDHLTKFAGARNADDFIEQRKAEISAEIAEKMENLSKQGLSGDDLKREQEKLLAEEKNAMEALDNAKQTYKQFVTTLDEDQQRLSAIDEAVKQKEQEIANLQKDLEQKQIKAETYAEKIKDLKEQVATLKNEHDAVDKHAKETKEKLDAYNIPPPKTPEEIKLEKAMLEIKGAVNGAGEISMTQLQEILDKLPPGARAQIAEKMAKENIHAVDRTQHVASAASLIDPIIEGKLLLNTFNKAAPLPDTQPAMAPSLAHGAKMGLNV